VLAPGAILGVGDVLVRYDVGPRRTHLRADPSLLGVSREIGEVLEDVALVAPRDTSVAIIGETGAGKELVAHALHGASKRRGALVSVNCGGLADTLLASELFGHRRGAFTGADREREGLVEAARQGTLFLDEVADASPAAQAALLRLMETRRYRKVGGDQELEADVRFVAACQPDIEQRVADGRFRADLWSRVARWMIDVPPLRERSDDVPLLALTFARRLAHDDDVVLAHALLYALLRYRWSGNVRELHNVMERAVVEARGAREIGLSPRVTAALREAPGEAPREPGAVDANGAPTERRRKDKTPRPTRELLDHVLNRHGGNVCAVADELGVMRRTVYRWAKALDIDIARLRDGGDGA
jgi:transcriptional regulator with PAS, ATPase and Fis domain